ncbi:MAG TPA: hypothetical protein VKT82_33330 [Ktedonobacterales bacterium]|nr:hypothetical protein [Ktedonobacterales bacterium]
MTLGDALKASRTLGQAINRSGTYCVTVAEKDDTLFQANQQPTIYIVSVMRDLTTRKCFEPVYESPLGLADIEIFLRRASNHPPTDDINPAAWEPVH